MKSQVTQWNLTINSTEPIFYYCAAPGSCLDKLMIGVINPNETQTLEGQIQAAKEATLMVKPGDPIPAEASSSLSAPSSQATSSSTSTPAVSEVHHHGLSGGAIAGIVVGGVAFVLICALLFFFVGRTKTLKDVMKYRDSMGPNAGQNGHGDFPAPSTPGFQGAFSPGQNRQTVDYSALPPYGQQNVTDEACCRD